MEQYGDIHLHHSNYPNNECPQSCGNQINYEHANICNSKPYGTSNPPQIGQEEGVAYKNGHAYDCGCNLCQSPYSVPYATGPGGFMGDMLQYKPCSSPNCRCVGCSGDCKCGCRNVEKFMDLGDNSLKNLLILAIIGAIIYYGFIYKK